MEDRSGSSLDVLSMLNGNTVAVVHIVEGGTRGADVKKQIESQTGFSYYEQVLMIGLEELGDQDMIPSECIAGADCIRIVLLDEARPFASLANLRKYSSRFTYAQVISDKKKVWHACGQCAKVVTILVEGLLGRVVRIGNFDSKDGIVQCTIMPNIEEDGWRTPAWLPAGALCPASFASLCRAGVLPEKIHTPVTERHVSLDVARAAAYWWLHSEFEDLHRWEAIGKMCNQGNWEAMLRDAVHTTSVGAIANLWIEASCDKFVATLFGMSKREEQSARQKGVLELLGKLHGDWDSTKARLAPEWMESAAARASVSAREQREQQLQLGSRSVVPQSRWHCLKKVGVALKHHGSKVTSACLQDVAHIVHCLEEPTERKAWSNIGRLQEGWQVALDRASLVTYYSFSD